MFGKLNELVTLREGAEADISIYSPEEGYFKFTDALGATRMGRQLLCLAAAVKAGKLYGEALGRFCNELVGGCTIEADHDT